MLIKIFFLFLTILPTYILQSCNITHYQFYSKYSLGKQQQLNRTFTQIQPLIKIPNVTYTQGTKIYTLHNFNLHFQYLDSNQRAIIINDNVFLIDGGVLEVTVQFNWTEQGIIVPLYGSGVSVIRSSDITFEKFLQYQKGYLVYKLGYAYDIMFKFSNFTLLRINPSNTSEQVKSALLTAFNVPNKNTSFRQLLPIQINKIYSNTLQKYVKNQHYPLDDHFDYTYVSPWSRNNFTINFLLFPTGFSLTQQGLSQTFVSNIKDDPKWKCGKMIPTSPRDISQYGGLQQFLSFTIIQNTLRYAFEKHYLDTFLNQINWETSFFQFHAGDLFQVIPSLAIQFIPRQRVQGNCTANTAQSVNAKRNSNYTINASIPYNCELSIQNIKIVNFQITLSSIIQLSANQTHLNFKVLESKGTPSFKSVPNFDIKNQVLAQLMVTRALDRLKEGYTFGSGWKTFPRDYPHTLIQDDYFLIYDSSHLNQTKTTTTMIFG